MIVETNKKALFTYFVKGLRQYYNCYNLGIRTSTTSPVWHAAAHHNNIGIY
jgi:hypothetical protein